jgi:hypothetical protein
MKSIIFFAPLLFIFSCSNNEHKKNAPSSDSSVVSTKVDSVYIDPELKNKITSAFLLLKKYAKESLVHPEEPVKKRINKYQQVCFGNIVIQSGYVTNIQIENPYKYGDLFIFFEDGERDMISGEIARTIHCEDFDAIVFKKGFVRKNCVSIVSSVIIHELTHSLLNQYHRLQNPNQKNENEYNAYSRQLDFLVFLYGGPKEELKSAECKSFSAYPTDSAKKHFHFFFHMVDSLRFQ